MVQSKRNVHPHMISSGGESMESSSDEGAASLEDDTQTSAELSSTKCTCSTKFHDHPVVRGDANDSTADMDSSSSTSIISTTKPISHRGKGQDETSSVFEYDDDVQDTSARIDERSTTPVTSNTGELRQKPSKEDKTLPLGRPLPRAPVLPKTILSAPKSTRTLNHNNDDDRVPAADEDSDKTR